GTNAHLILEEAPAPIATAEEEERPGLPAVPLLLSAKAPEALASQGERLAAHLEANPGLHLPDLAHTLIAHRAQLEHRALVVGADVEDLGEGLTALARGAEHPALQRGRAASQGKVAFLFPGQGSRWPEMGRDLLASSEPFAASIARCEEALEPFVDFPLAETLRSERDDWLSQVEVLQPALFAVMVSLAEVWRSHGVSPDAVLGHSQGEIAAAVVAGALSLEDGARVSALRAAAIAEIAGAGGMVALALARAEAEELISGFGSDLSFAAHNGAAATVVSGTTAALEDLLALCEERGVRARRIPVDYASHSPQVEAIEARIRSDLAPVAPGPAAVELFSSLSGAAIEGAELDAEYWYRSLREPVRFADAAAALIERGGSALIEVSPHPVLTMALSELGAQSGREVAVLHTLRRDQGGPRRLAEALGEAHLAGVEVDFAPLLAPARPKTVEAPTYPFQRQRYWLQASGGGDPAALGMRAAGHPLLAGSVELAGGGHLFTGHLSLARQPWLADHALLGSVLVPGVAIVELCLTAGAELGAETLEELTIEAPMLVAEDEGLELQVRVGEPDEEGRREVEVHSRARGGEEPFARHAGGWLAEKSATSTPAFGGQWPPAGSEPLETADLYPLLAERGFDYGPAFQGLDSAWVLDEEIYAEVSLDPEQADGAESFGLHPALFDAALQPLFLAAPYKEGRPVPFSFSGVALHRRGADSLLVRLTVRGRSLSLLAADGEGQPVIAIESLATREADPERLRAAAPDAGDSLFLLAWRDRELEQVEQPAEPSTVFRCQPDRSLSSPAAARELCERALAAAQAHLAGEADDDETPERLCFLTQGAVAAGEGETPDPAQAAVWGLIRVAISEHPGRFCLVDTDGTEASEAALADALAQTGEPQLALREGAALVPRLAPAPEPEEQPPPLDPEKTVLVTGATGTLGAAVARHLVSAHGARHLLLLSRRGEKAPGASELRAELEELGASVEVRACDVADRDQLAAALVTLSDDHPLGAVVHCAAGLRDALLEAQGPESLETAFAAKAGGAFALHELCEEAELTDFVLYSSLAGMTGNSGLAAYAAANAFCDALAQGRRAEGSPATSIAWGHWAQESELTAGLAEADRARLRRGGLVPMPTEQGLELLDRARALPEALVAAGPIDRAAVRRSLAAGTASPLLAGLVPAGRRRPARGGAFAERLAAAPAAEREAMVRGLVAEHAAAILGHGSAAAIDASASFKDLGFDSLGAVELRNRLSAALGERLEATLIFDYPSPAALGAELAGRMQPGEARAANDQEERMRQRIAAIPLGRLRESGLLEMLLALGGEASASEAEEGQIDEMDLDSLVRKTLEASGAEGRS
ncbi:MAG: SDR family NAD(P)-dependent oxidoreductase, partial [Solirubrobacterales bacterium]